VSTSQHPPNEDRDRDDGHAVLTTIALAAALLAAPLSTIHATGVQLGDTCSILTNEGHCPVAGQFCRNADLGKSTTNADGREIDCVEDGARGHWEYGG
jgi:hypothetical protein